MNKKTQEVMFSSAMTEYQTPPEDFKELDDLYHFTLDAAATKENALCKKYFTKEDDGLAQSWAGERVFLNPPYGKKENPCKRKVDAMTGEVTYLCKKKICKERGYHIDKALPDTGAWIEKAYNESLHCLAVLLISARPGTVAWHKYIFMSDGKTPQPGVDYRFEKGRKKFLTSSGESDAAPFDSAVVIFNRGNVVKLPPSLIDVKIMALWEQVEKYTFILSKMKKQRERIILFLQMFLSIDWSLADKLRTLGLTEEAQTLIHLLSTEIKPVRRKVDKVSTLREIHKKLRRKK